MPFPSYATHDVIAYFGSQASDIPYPDGLQDSPAANIPALRPVSFQCDNNYEARTWHMNIRTIS